MQSLQEVYRRSQPLLEQLKMSAVPHQHFLVDIIGARVINIMYSTRCSAAIPDKTSLKISTGQMESTTIFFQSRLERHMS